MSQELEQRIMGTLAVLRTTTDLDPEWLKKIAARCRGANTRKLAVVLDSLSTTGYNFGIKWQRDAWMSGVEELSNV
jgi:hypothetical protein